MVPLIDQWRRELANLEAQLAAFDDPVSLHTRDGETDTTFASKLRVTDRIAQLHGLIEHNTAGD